MEGEERARKEGPVTSNYTPLTSHLTANGKLSSGGAERVISPTECLGVASSGGFAGLAAKMMDAKVKVQGNRKASKSDSRKNKQNACDDDLPLGSEAHNLSLEHAASVSRQFPLVEDQRSTLPKAVSQGIMGWQSFSSDVSNHTSASSASLEQLLNDRQVDPEEMLLNLGFGGEPRNLMPTLARVPERFLNHPSRAYGIAPPSVSDELQEEVDSDGVDAALPIPENVVGASATSAAAAAAHPKRRTGIWTLARTLSLLRLKSTATRGHMSPTLNGSGTHPHPNYPKSILHPANQRYLASKGFYEKQGWPKGSFAQPEEDLASVVKEKVEAAKDAESRRKMFQKTKSRRNWSMCDSDENDPFSGSREWVTKSVDDSRSQGDVTGPDDSLGHGTYFSTTESSTDSLDTPNLETERAFENIRREFHESRRTNHSSSDDLFMPVRKKRLSSEVSDINENVLTDYDLNLLSTNGNSTNYFVSPASSRQTTVEKAPTISEQALSVNVTDEVEGENKNRESDTKLDIGQSSIQGNKNVYVGHMCDDGVGDVRIVISTSDSGQNRPHNKDGQNAKSGALMVDNPQAASSDSGSSSNATVVGGNYLALAADDPDLRRLSESEHSVTDRDSISRSNSPCRFNPDHAMVQRMTSSSCQTTDTDFIMAAAVAASHLPARVTTQTTKDRPILRVHIKESEVTNPTSDTKAREYVLLEQSPKVQLSTLPPTISHLELMRRLQHSQNDLSRMGSVQSDSSGFGDADPGIESVVQDSENVKLTSLGSSNESGRTLASSATNTVVSTQRREEMATQTSLDSDRVEVLSCQVKTSRDFRVEAHPDQAEESQNSDDRNNHYVTLCYIPTLNSRIGQSQGLRHRVGSTDFHDHQDGGEVVAPAWRSRSGSEPQRPAVLYNDQGYLRARVNTASGSEFVKYIGPTRQPYGEMYSSQQGVSQRVSPLGTSVLSYDSQGSQQSNAASGSIVVQRHIQHTTGNDVYKHRNNVQDSQQQGFNQGWQPGSPEKHRQGAVGRSPKRFRSQIDLYASPGGFSRRNESYSSRVASPRRHSDEGILEGRNNTPLAVELALARTSGNKMSASSHSAYTDAGTSNAETMLSMASSNNSNNNNTTRISSFSTQDSHSVETPARFKTEVGFHYPPLAGNISGLQAGFRQAGAFRGHAFRSTARQRSCDILDDDFDERYQLTGSPLSRNDPELDSQASENLSDISVQSLPEAGTKTGLLDARKLSRLIHQPIHFMGRRRSSLYRSSHRFQDWSLMSKRKRQQEESRLMQNAIQKYKTELTIMEASFMLDYQTVYEEMMDQEREEAQELEWLFGEVKGEILDMENLLMAKVKAVHAGNDFHNLLSNLGVIKKMVELVKEQLCQQHLAGSQAEEQSDPGPDDDLDILDEMTSRGGGRPGSFQHSLSWMGEAGHMSTPRSSRRVQSYSLSNLSQEQLNVSLEQMKSSMLSEVKQEILESTKKLEHDLKEKDREIRQLQEQLGSRHVLTSDPQSRRYTPRSSVSRSSRVLAGSLVRDKASQETDV